MNTIILRQRVMVLVIATFLSLAAAFATSAVTASEAEAQRAPGGSGGNGGPGGDAVTISAALNFVEDNVLSLLSR